MQIISYTIKNVGRFENLHILLAPHAENSKGNVTVVVGNNGAGKTTLLKALATSLSWLVARIRSENGNGSPIREKDIRNGETHALIEIGCENGGGNFESETLQPEFIEHWSLVKARKGRKATEKSSLSGLDIIADLYRERLTKDNNTSLPLIAFYGVERVVIDIPLKIRGKHSFEQVDGYDNSLSKGVDFRRFFEWFREREDTENESTINDDLLEQLSSLFGKDDAVWEKLTKLKASSRDRQLTAVRSAITTFMPDFKNLRVRRKPRLHMSVEKNGERLDVAQLSQGEKSLMALVGDLARRLAMMNPGLNNPLHGEGIVMIDEVDMHLHPQWQRTLIDRLTKTFPNCQFVLTTHSPLVISDSPDLLVYQLDDGELRQVESLFGEDANSVLLDVMNTEVRNSTLNRHFLDLYDAIQCNKLDDAKKLIRQLELQLPASNIELVKAHLLLKKQELRREKS